MHETDALERTGKEMHYNVPVKQMHYCTRRRYRETDALEGTMRQMHLKVHRNRCTRKYSERDALEGTKKRMH